ncbi:MAG: acetylglutamate kinase [Gammaproteobacteria bacterium]|nr:acetylglutamate kinase [Gammaproteobacteria bacterium]
MKMQANRQTRRIIVRLLSNLGSRQEVAQYLKRYSDLDEMKFAVVKVGGGILEHHMKELCSSLTFLQQVGLTPIVIHGAGPQLSRELQEAGIQSETVDGFRVTSPEILRVARRVFQRENLRLTDALNNAGTQAASITGGVFEAEVLDEQRYGMVGKVSTVNIEPLRSAVRAHVIPVISPLAETTGGQILNINADVAANKLVESVQPFKIIFLTSTGGILNANENIIPSINLSTDFERLMNENWLHSGMRVKLQQVNDMLRQLPLDSSVSITTPELLARELFTHRGSGTLVRLGERIITHDSWDSVDKARLRELLETSFGKSLAQDYFDSTKLKVAYVSEAYRAAALITQGDGVDYLDKYAVTEKAQGEGLGGAVWRAIKAKHPALYWRARPDNAVNSFYFREADGFMKSGGWLVFWYGLASLPDIERLVKQAAAAPATMTGADVGEA